MEYTKFEKISIKDTQGFNEKWVQDIPGLLKHEGTPAFPDMVNQLINKMRK